MVTNEQLYIIIGIPMLWNVLLTILCIVVIGRRFDVMYQRLEQRDRRRAEHRRGE